MIFDYPPDARGVDVDEGRACSPQDMLFLDDGRHGAGHRGERTRRQRAPLITPGFAIASVLELNGGQSRKRSASSRATR